MSDLIERLRRGDASFYYATMKEAADELERLIKCGLTMTEQSQQGNCAEWRGKNEDD